MEHYKHFAREEATLKVTFQSDKITLDIPEDGTTIQGWRITPRSRPTVSFIGTYKPVNFVHVF